MNFDEIDTKAALREVERARRAMKSEIRSPAPHLHRIEVLLREHAERNEMDID